MPIMSGIVNPLREVATEDFDARYFEIKGGQIVVKDPAIVNLAGSAGYPTTPYTDTLRFGQGMTANGGVVLHDPTLTPGKEMIIVNSSSFPQAIAGANLQPLTGAGSVTSIAPNTSYTVQSVEGVWVTVDQSVPPAAGQDFFRSVTGAALPDGVADYTEAIRHDGLFGVTVDPLTTLDNAGSHGDGVRVLLAAGTAAIADTVLPADSTIAVEGPAPVDMTLPDAAAWPRRILTFRLDWRLQVSQVTLNTAAAQLEHIGGARSSKIFLNSRSVAAVTVQSIGGFWRVIDWTERAFYPTAGYSPNPANSTTTASFNSLGLPNPAAGTPFQIPAGVTDFLVRNSNYVGAIALPLQNTATGRFSVWVQNEANGTFPTPVSPTGTDLPQTVTIADNQNLSMHFEWSNGLWRWVYAPEPPRLDLMPYSYKNPNSLPATVLTPNTNTPAGSGVVPNGTAAFVTTDSNYVGTVTLPPVDATSVPVVVTRQSAFPVTVLAANTTMPSNLALGPLESGRFIPSLSDNKWHWIPAEINPPATAAATTNVDTWTQGGGLVSTVNGVATTVAIPAGVPTQMLGYDAAGKPVYQAIKKYVTLEAAPWGAVGANTPVSQQYYGVDAAQSTPFVDVYTYDAFLDITGTGSPLTLANPPANLSALMVGREVTVKLMGAWTGTQVVNGNIDGATSYSFTKAAATGVNAFPSRTFKWTGTAWRVV
jgi:hypothetical protein